jgi:hypothetical protein
MREPTRAIAHFQSRLLICLPVSGLGSEFSLSPIAMK